MRTIDKYIKIIISGSTASRKTLTITCHCLKKSFSKYPINDIIGIFGHFNLSKTISKPQIQLFDFAIHIQYLEMGYCDINGQRKITYVVLLRKNNILSCLS